MNRILPILAALAIAFAAGAAQAKPAACKDASGKFTKCPAAAAAPATPDKPAKAEKCKDAKGKFTKLPGGPPRAGAGAGAGRGPGERCQAHGGGKARRGEHRADRVVSGRTRRGHGQVQGRHLQHEQDP
jgi:hypothetical protein